MTSRDRIGPGVTDSRKEGANKKPKSQEVVQ